MSLLFNMLSRFVIAFLPGSKCLLITWLQTLSAVILELRKYSLSLFPLFPHLFAMKWLQHVRSVKNQSQLAGQGILKSLLQHHSSKASILQCSTVFIGQLSHPYMSIGKNIALTIQTFVRKVMTLLFNMLSKFIIAFLPRRKCLLISWLQSPSDFQAKENKVCHCFHCFHIYLPWSDGTKCHDLSFLNVEF